LRPHFQRLGKIKDISRGGLAFEYLCTEGCGEGSSEIDVFLSGNGFHLPKIPCEIVYDCQIGEDSTSMASFQHRQCGVEFGQLTGEHETKLQLFLDKYLTGTA